MSSFFKRVTHDDVWELERKTHHHHHHHHHQVDEATPDFGHEKARASYEKKLMQQWKQQQTAQQSPLYAPPPHNTTTATSTTASTAASAPLAASAAPASSIPLSTRRRLVDDEESAEEEEPDYWERQYLVGHGGGTHVHEYDESDSVRRTLVQKGSKITVYAALVALVFGGVLLYELLREITGVSALSTLDNVSSPTHIHNWVCYSGLVAAGCLIFTSLCTLTTMLCTQRHRYGVAISFILTLVTLLATVIYLTGVLQQWQTNANNTNVSEPYRNVDRPWFLFILAVTTLSTLLSVYGFHKFRWGFHWRGSVLRASYLWQSALYLGVSLLLLAGALYLLFLPSSSSISALLQTHKEVFGRSLFYWWQLSLYGSVICLSIISILLMSNLYVALKHPALIANSLSFSLYVVPLCSFLLLGFSLLNFFMCHELAKLSLLGAGAAVPVQLASLTHTVGLLYFLSIVSILVSTILTLPLVLAVVYWRNYIKKHGVDLE